MVQKARNDNNGPRVRRGNLDEEEGDDIGLLKIPILTKLPVFHIFEPSDSSRTQYLTIYSI